MILIRLCKVLLTLALAGFAAIVAYDNVIDYGMNYTFVQHVLTMDTTFPDNTLKGRAITNETVWRVAYTIVIVAEAATALLLILGAGAMAKNLRAPAARFNRAKALMVAGATVGFGLWFFGFMAIAGEYFTMWESKSWNTEEAAFRFYMAILGVLIFVSLRDEELA